MSVSQFSWDPINQLGHIKFVSCTKLQTERTSRLFVVSLKIFLANLRGFFLNKICVGLVGLIEDGVSPHWCFYVRRYLCVFTYGFIKGSSTEKSSCIF